jgi:hypothetical protein
MWHPIAELHTTQTLIFNHSRPQFNRKTPTWGGEWQVAPFTKPSKVKSPSWLTQWRCYYQLVTPC